MRKITFVVPLIAVSLTACSTPTPSPETYTISWVNYNNEILKVDENVKKGEMPHYDGSTPTREDDEQYSYVFSGWSPALKEVTEDVTYKATYTAKGHSLVKISIPSTATDLGITFYYDLLEGTELKVDWGDGTIDSQSSHTYDQSGDYNIVIHNVTNLKFGSQGITPHGEEFIKEVHLGDLNNEVIERYAFYECKNMTYVHIPDGVETIGDCAFIRCFRLSSINIPNTVRNIDESAFRDCDSLTKIVIPDSVAAIGYNAFRDCDKLTIVDLTRLDSVPVSYGSIFEGHSQDLRLYVKEEMLDDFKAATGWKDYADIITSDPVPTNS